MALAKVLKEQLDRTESDSGVADPDQFAASAAGSGETEGESQGAGYERARGGEYGDAGWPKSSGSTPRIKSAPSDTPAKSAETRLTRAGFRPHAA